jgi:hypothetical protein
MRIRVYTVQETAVLFDAGNPLYGFSRSRITPDLLRSERAEKLLAALAGEQPVLGILPDERLAALDLASFTSFRRYAIEEES